MNSNPNQRYRMICIVCKKERHPIYFMVNDKHNYDSRGDICEDCHDCYMAKCGVNY